MLYHMRKDKRLRKRVIRQRLPKYTSVIPYEEIVKKEKLIQNRDKRYEI